MRVAPVCDWFLTYTACLAAALARGGAEVTSLCRDHSWRSPPSTVFASTGKPWRLGGRPGERSR